MIVEPSLVKSTATVLPAPGTLSSSLLSFLCLGCFCFLSGSAPSQSAVVGFLAGTAFKVLTFFPCGNLERLFISFSNFASNSLSFRSSFTSALSFLSLSIKSAAISVEATVPTAAPGITRASAALILSAAFLAALLAFLVAAALAFLAASSLAFLVAAALAFLAAVLAAVA